MKETSDATIDETIDKTIRRVEQLYVTLTGARPPNPNGHSIAFPPEVDPAVHVQEQLDRMVAAVEQLVPQAPWQPRSDGRTAEGPAWMPHANVWAQDEDIIVLAVDVPGVPRDQIRIRVEPHALTVTGRRPTPWMRPPQGLPMTDAPLGAFQRVFPFPSPIARERVGARLDDGVLTIRVHARTRPEPSQISIS